jgi:hypothetical protein
VCGAVRLLDRPPSVSLFQQDVNCILVFYLTISSIVGSRLLVLAHTDRHTRQ